MNKMKELGIYIHIPFCVQKCNYCDFLSFPAGDDLRAQYLDALEREIAAFPCAEEYHAVSVFLGGGTPSVLRPDQIRAVLDVVRTRFDVRENAEITMECNPGTGTDFRALKQAGINRISFGVQSADDARLKTLGRIHTWHDAETSFFQAREAGFDNLSVDLIFSLPGQTVSAWEQSLEAAVRLGPEHISAYSLIIEEGTRFYDLYHEEDERRAAGEKTRMLPDEDAEREMYHRTGEILAGAGYLQYEISNYARPGYESVHNNGYWIRREYAGFGLGASSQIRDRRYRNTTGLDTYLQDPVSRCQEETLTKKDAMSETMFLGMRRMEGVSRTAFRETFGQDIDEAFPGAVSRLTGQGLLEEAGDRIRLTRRGIDLSNYVFSAFV